jgi:Cytidylate kinase-like family
MAIVTISRLTGSGGREIATAAAQTLNFQFIDRGVIDGMIDQQFPVQTEQLSRIKKDRRVYHEMVRSAAAPSFCLRKSRHRSASKSSPRYLIGLRG